MATWDVRLLGGSYSRIDADEERVNSPSTADALGADGTVVVELFGRTAEGRSVTILAYGFRPYFFIVEPSQDVIDELDNDPDILELSDEVLEVNNIEHEVTRVVLRYPWTVPSYRNRYQRDYTVLAADIPFAHRFIYDNDITSCTRVTGREAASSKYRSELTIVADAFEHMEPFKPSLSVLSFDIENSIERGEVYVIGYAFRSSKGELTKGYVTNEYGEDRLLREFVRLIEGLDPDILTGYNIDGYDLPHLLERMKRHNIDFSIARDGSDLRETSGRFWRLKGRSIADAWWNAKREVKLKKETLNAVAKELLGKEKLDINPLKIDELWQTERDKVIEYCVVDAELALEILEKIEVIDKMMDLATVSKLPLDDVLNGRTSSLIDSILIRTADRAGVGVPCTFRDAKTRKIEGGYVHQINPGIYDWVCVLDFRAMYPSIIISNNICFTTLDNNGVNVSPIGVRFLDKDERKGIVPSILEQLMNDRDETKRKMKEATTPEERHYYDGLQGAIKILMNSFYGVFASAFYRFTNQDIGASITAYARENIKGVINDLESRDIDVVYSDTDSVFFLSPNPDLDGTIEFGKTIADEFSKEDVVLEFEKILNPFFSHGAKKRYIGKVVWPDETTLVRGYETRRTDSYDLLTKALTELFELVLSHEIEPAVQLAKDTIDRIRHGEVEVESLVISRTCKEFIHYKNPERLAWVQAAKKSMALGYDFVPGMKVSWIVTDSRRTPQEVQPYVDGAEFDAVPDWEYYAERASVSLARVTEVFGWDARSLLSGHQQSDLFSFSGPAEEPSQEEVEEIELEGDIFDGSDEEDAAPDDDAGVDVEPDDGDRGGAVSTIPEERPRPAREGKVTLEDFL